MNGIPGMLCNADMLQVRSRVSLVRQLSHSPRAPPLFFGGEMVSQPDPYTCGRLIAALDRKARNLNPNSRCDRPLSPPRNVCLSSCSRSSFGVCMQGLGLS